MLQAFRCGQAQFGVRPRLGIPTNVIWEGKLRVSRVMSHGSGSNEFCACILAFASLGTQRAVYRTFGEPCALRHHP